MQLLASGIGVHPQHFDTRLFGQAGGVELVHPHIIYQHGALGKSGQNVGLDGDVQQQILIGSEGPGAGVFHRRLVGVMHPTIDAEHHFVGTPLEFIHMKSGAGGGNGLTTFVHRIARTRGGVHGALHKILVVAPMLHQVDFAASRPRRGAKAQVVPISTVLVDVFAQQPNGRPGADAGGQLGAHFYPPLLEGKFGVQPGRGMGFGVALVGEIFFLGHEVQLTVGHIAVGSAIGVMLNFAVEPAAASRQLGLMKPFGGVDRAAAVELVGPNQLAVRRWRGRRAVE